jgi:hypothetical protein
MNAHLLEELNQSNKRECDEVNALYLTGATIKRLAVQNGHVEPKDSDGCFLFDDVLYCVTNQGIWEVS